MSTGRTFPTGVGAPILLEASRSPGGYGPSPSSTGLKHCSEDSRSPAPEIFGTARLTGVCSWATDHSRPTRCISAMIFGPFSELRSTAGGLSSLSGLRAWFGATPEPTVSRAWPAECLALGAGHEREQLLGLRRVLAGGENACTVPKLDAKPTTFSFTLQQARNDFQMSSSSGPPQDPAGRRGASAGARTDGRSRSIVIVGGVSPGPAATAASRRTCGDVGRGRPRSGAAADRARCVHRMASL